MKIEILVLITVILVRESAFGQKVLVDLAFTAVDSAAYVKLDSIKIINRTQGGETMIFWPDTTLSFEIVPGDTLLYIGYSSNYPIGIHEIIDAKKQFYLFQNYPNPVEDNSIISMYMPQNGRVHIMVTDIQGRVVITSDYNLDQGLHSFRFIPGDDNLFFLTAQMNGVVKSIKIVSTDPNSSGRCILNYTGSFDGEPNLKANSQTKSFIIRESGILDSPNNNKTFTFQFATNIPCPGTPIVEYEGHVYNTIQIFSQCWIKENLNVGTLITHQQKMTNDSIIEKYCFANIESNCDIYGGLYTWDEMMKYTTQQGAQGICPLGWHIPTDEEWKVLEGAVDSRFGIGDPEWDLYWEYRGYDAGLNLKTTSEWDVGGEGTDLYGFSGLPGGARGSTGYYSILGGNGLWWPSTEVTTDRVFNRYLDATITTVGRMIDEKGTSCSVRCIRD